MALFDECMQKCAQKVLDLADIVRDGDFSPSDVCRAAGQNYIGDGRPNFFEIA